MNGSDDQALLGNFVRHGSQPAFRALVERYAGLVFASARRQVHGDDHLADDVAQAVFIVLARRAGSISDATALPAWLIKTTHFAARDALKMQARRRKHERKAAEMAPTQTLAPEPAVSDLEPIIDAALARLKKVDRNIVTRRFLQRQPVEQVAVEMKMTEAAVRKRLSRAMPKLRSFLSARGMTLSLGILAALLDEFRPTPANAALIDQATTSALSGTTGTPAAIAQRILRRILLIRITIAASATMMLIALVLLATALRGAGPSPGRSIAATIPTSAPIKVGILLSDYSAHYPNDNGVTNGYAPMYNLFNSLNDPTLERFAVIEPGTRDKPEMDRYIRTYFGVDHVIDGSDAAALKSLDVLVCPIAINMRDNVLAAFVTAVRDGGVGIMNQCTTGCFHPGDGEMVNQINGMTRSGCFYNDSAEFECNIVAADHPLMSRFRKPTLRLRNLSGSVGIIRGGQPLIAAPSSLHNHHTISSTLPPEATFYPLYTATLGKGRIVGIGWGEAQPSLDAAGAPDFYVRCVRWLAHRDSSN